MTLTWQDLFLTTLKDPGSAAEVILGLDLQRSVIWQGLVAAAALNAFLSGLMLQAVPLPEGFPPFLNAPLAYFAIVAGGLVLLAHVLTWTGRGLGGSGGSDDMLALMVWLQVVRVVLQAVGIILIFAVPLVGGLFNLAAGILSLWILLHFVKVGHRLETLGSAALVLFVAVTGMVLGLSLFISLIGFGSLGV